VPIAATSYRTSVGAGEPAGDYVMIRGRALPLDQLLTVDITSADLIASQRTAFCSAKPFEHIVIDGLFNEQLLNLIEEEFPTSDADRLTNIAGSYESTYRSQRAADLGPAAQIYFNVVNGNAFVSYLSALTSIPNLITDHTLLGGGLHETRGGGRFGVHLDFNYHYETMLTNTLVLLTYLNRDWKPEYGGALELWDAKSNERAKEVAPVFGRSILFRHSDRSFHGHPSPLTPPPGRSRRSLGCYYYINDQAKYRRFSWQGSQFLDELHIRKQPLLKRARHRLAELRAIGVKENLKYVARGITPPMVWSAAKALQDVIRKPQH
jgi:Rps23 Pro-64 3,4-dihydroxylase Tpa1-like proline 4-hydroxylase